MSKSWYIYIFGDDTIWYKGPLIYMVLYISLNIKSPSQDFEFWKYTFCIKYAKNILCNKAICRQMAKFDVKLYISFQNELDS